METPWPDAGRELERMGAHILELIPSLGRCVSSSPEGVQLRLFLPRGSVRFHHEQDAEGKVRRFALEYPPTGALVEILALLHDLERFTPLVPASRFQYQQGATFSTLDLNLRITAAPISCREEG
jgi:hypothetical protein